MKETNHEEETIRKDFQTGEPLASPYIKILKAYSPHAPVCINSTTLRDIAEFINHPTLGAMEDYIGRSNLQTPEGADYALLGVVQAYNEVDGEYDVSGEIFSEKIMGFLPQDVLEDCLDKVAEYFCSPAPEIQETSGGVSVTRESREIEEPIPEDDIPF